MPPDPFASLPRNGLYVVVFSASVAIVLTVVGWGHLGPNVVYSLCIGLIVWALPDVGRRLLWPGKLPPPGRMIALVTAGLVLAWLAGSWLAALVLGQIWETATTVRGVTVLFITAAASVAVSLYFREREKAAHTRSRAETIERQIAQARLRMLQAQIEPHFLFNTLANLRALIPTDPARAQVMLDELNDFLRAAFAAARNERNTLAGEFALLRAYLTIIGIRMGERLRFRLDLPAVLADNTLPPMLLQPLVENAIKHGVEPKITGGEVAVHACREDSRLVLTVADTGLGLAGRAADSMRTGVVHVRERLAAIYGDAASLELATNALGGVTATLRLPVER